VAVCHPRGVEPTNHAAECRFVERMLTVASTCQQQQRDSFTYLTDAVTAHWSGAPTLKMLANP
jgi:hypothetical protein